jgi:hypothetical protein
MLSKCAHIGGYMYLATPLKFVERASILYVVVCLKAVSLVITSIQNIYYMISDGSDILRVSVILQN